jgi:CBS domain-containing protein
MHRGTAMSSVITETVTAFLKNVPPFQFLSATDLATLSRHISLEYFPAKTLVLSAGNEASNSLFIVLKGGVKLAIATDTGEEVVIDYRSEGDIFGLLSVLGKDTARLDVTTVEDTLCYSVPRAEVDRLISEHAEFGGYLLRTSLARYMDHSLAEIRSQSRLLGESERLLYSLSAREVSRNPALTCGKTATLQHVAQMMSSVRSSAMIVVDGSGQAVGIVTDQDFTTKVIARGMSFDLPVTHIMSGPVVTVEGGERVFQVLLKMLAQNIHHVLVTEAGVPKHVVTHHDLILLQGKSPLNIARHIEEQRTLDGLVTAQEQASHMVPLLIRESARASHITRVVAEINDRVMKKILDLAGEQLGEAPMPYCWVVLGSEGRREQTFKTDQDNAVIYADPDEGTRRKAEEYFERLAVFAQDALARCGYPACLGGFMASNPRWRKPLSEWKADFHHWITDPVMRGVQDALIFFDMRAVAGNFHLLQELTSYNRELLQHASLFKSVLAHVSINHKPPLGFFRTFVVEQSGEHKDELDVKLFGTWPIVNIARLFALETGIDQTNTVDRLHAHKSSNPADQQLFDELEQAFEFLTLLRLERQSQQMRSAQQLTNYVSPESLTHLQRSLLKEAFQTIGRGQSLVDQRYRSAVWSQLR